MAIERIAGKGEATMSATPAGYEIQLLIHCPSCAQEAVAAGRDIKDEARKHLDVGTTECGQIQVWCRQHQKSVFLEWLDR